MDNRNELVKFFEIDLDHLMNQLENTNKRMQFIFHIFIFANAALLTYIITNQISDDYKISILSSGVTALGGIIFCYIIHGTCLHKNYICRINLLRYFTLNELGVKKNMLKHYPYVGKPKFTRLGMNNIQIISIAVVSFIWIVIALSMSGINVLSIFCIILVMIFWIFNIVYYAIAMKRTKRSIDKTWKEKDSFTKFLDD